MTSATRICHSITCCRILLNLKQAATPKGYSTTVSKDIDFVIPPGEGQSDQAETLPLEACDTGDDEENRVGGMVETSSSGGNYPGVEVG